MQQLQPIARGWRLERALAEPDRSSAAWQRYVAWFTERIGDVLRKQGRLDEALAAFRDYLTMQGQAARNESDDVSQD